MSRDIVIYGAGGFARETAWLADECGFVPAAFIDDSERHRGTRVNELEVISLEAARTRFGGGQISIAVGNPSTRELLTNKAVDAGFRVASLIHPRVERSRWIEFGEGVVVCAGAILTTNIRVGRHVQINLDCTIGHDVVLNDYSTLAPGVHLSGWVHVQRGAYLGTGAVVINGTEREPLIVGAGAVVGAGACVVKSVEPGTTVVGVPAKCRSIQQAPVVQR